MAGDTRASHFVDQSLDARRSRARLRDRKRERSRTPEYLAAALARQRTPEAKAAKRAYRQRPERRAITIATQYMMPIEIPGRLPPESCECCGEVSTRTLHFDHCHATGRFRGWCCHGCNNGTGIKDSPKLLRLRALYLERSFQPGLVNWAFPSKPQKRKSRMSGA
jgi:hypothetical protein